MLRSYAQNLEDIVLWRALGDVSAGVYVDVGAADPVADSVTKLFYEHGWRGVNVEPLPEFAAALRADRPRDQIYEVCAGPAEDEVVLHTVPGTGLSTLVADVADSARGSDRVVEDRKVPMRRLDELLAEAGLAGQPIHFLKIDVEGAEQGVIEGLDLATWRPWVLVVESTYPGTTTQNYDGWHDLVVSHSYEFCLFDGLNRFYLAAEHAGLTPKLAYPACVFDQPFVSVANPTAHAELLAMYAKLQESADRLDGELTRTMADYAGVETELLHTQAEYARVETELLHTQAGYARVDAELARTQAEYARVEAELLRTQANYQVAVGQVATLRTNVAQISESLDDERTRRAEAERSTKQARGQCVDAEARLVALQHSTFWRSTAPIRQLVDFVKRVRR